jgi:hypothetical protein
MAIFGKQYLTLSHKVELYLPTRTMTHDEIDPEKLRTLREKIARQLSAMFGGCTVTPAIGFYDNKTLAALQLEDVEILCSYSATLTRAQAHEVIKLGELIKSELEQESVMFVIDQKALFV